MTIPNKAKIDEELAALEMTDAQAIERGFENVAHYKAVFRKFMELCTACSWADGNVNCKSMLDMAIMLMKAVYIMETRDMAEDDDRKLEKSKSFFNLAMAMVLESIGGKLLTVDDKPVTEAEPLPLSAERKEDETLH